MDYIRKVGPCYFLQTLTLSVLIFFNILWMQFSSSLTADEMYQTVQFWMGTISNVTRNTEKYVQVHIF